MADLSDVSTALVNLIGTALYPNGSAQPSAVGLGIKIFPGWPVPTQLDADLLVGIANVSVYPRPESRNTTRYMDSWQTVSVNSATLSLSAIGQTVTVSGTIPPAGNPHNLAIFVNGKAYIRAVLTGDTLSSIAAAMAALIAGDVSGTTSAGPVITVGSSGRIGAVRVGVSGTASNEVRRQEQLFQVGVWASTPAARDQIAAFVDNALAATRRFTLADQAVCRLIWKSSLQSDRSEKSNLYRRDLFYTAEYPTLSTETETQITQEQTNVSVAVAGVLPYAPVATIYD